MLSSISRSPRDQARCRPVASVRSGNAQPAPTNSCPCSASDQHGRGAGRQDRCAAPGHVADPRCRPAADQHRRAARRDDRRRRVDGGWREASSVCRSPTTAAGMPPIRTVATPRAGDRHRGGRSMSPTRAAGGTSFPFLRRVWLVDPDEAALDGGGRAAGHLGRRRCRRSSRWRPSGPRSDVASMATFVPLIDTLPVLVETVTSCLAVTVDRALGDDLDRRLALLRPG